MARPSKSICQVDYADFVVWTPGGIHVEHILHDEGFFIEAVDKISSFYMYGVLPEIFGKWYTSSQFSLPVSLLLVVVCIPSLGIPHKIIPQKQCHSYF